MMILERGFKGKDVAAQMGMTPSAVSQRYKKLKEEIVIPYFRENFDMDLDMPEVMPDFDMVREEVIMETPTCGHLPMDYLRRSTKASFVMEKKRTTPEYITSLQPNEIFVFGSNLRGMHGGGAAYGA